MPFKDGVRTFTGVACRLVDGVEKKPEAGRFCEEKNPFCCVGAGGQGEEEAGAAPLSMMKSLHCESI
jgi:hypothetical protein